MAVANDTTYSAGCDEMPGMQRQTADKDICR